MRQAWIPTPLGPMLAIAGADRLHLLDWDEGDRLDRGRRRLAPLGHVSPGETTVHAALRAELAAYFAGTSARFATRPDQPGPPFRQAVWAALAGLPPGTTASYAGLAARLGRPFAARAVGAANGANLISILVPCHRLLGAGGALTGYGGGLARKRWLLDHEARAFAPAAPHSR